MQNTVCVCVCVRARARVRACVRALLANWQKESVMPTGQEAVWFCMLFLTRYDKNGIHVQIIVCPVVIITYLSHLVDIQ